MKFDNVASNQSTVDITMLPSFDQPYTFGHPKDYMRTRELARLLILRGRLQDAYGQPLLSVVSAL